MLVFARAFDRVQRSVLQLTVPVRIVLTSGLLRLRAAGSWQHRRRSRLLPRVRARSSVRVSHGSSERVSDFGDRTTEWTRWAIGRATHTRPGGAIHARANAGRSVAPRRIQHSANVHS